MSCGRINKSTRMSHCLIYDVSREVFLDLQRFFEFFVVFVNIQRNYLYSLF